MVLHFFVKNLFCSSIYYWHNILFLGWLSPLLGAAALLVVLAVGIQLSSKFLRKPLKGNGFAAPGWYKVGDVFR